MKYTSDQSQQEWMEKECPKCFQCGNRVSKGTVLGLKIYCDSCADEIIRQAAKEYDELPRNAQGKIIARRPRD